MMKGKKFRSSDEANQCPQASYLCNPMGVQLHRQDRAKGGAQWRSTLEPKANQIQEIQSA